ncbi:glycosyl hydrolase [Pedobacter cryotolerans]|uniref:Glycoside hydrolase family 2 n=1 Tax=Pedobacter cryotolerans TaxID=2571270 RepID=A0A4U1C9S1_9SPHI|nr:glycosyl hydrolase [Pedobacter cryotolerans]TKC01526.1 glycoside hydrolase family 2 [Pedobacter cryotolerans]
MKRRSFLQKTTILSAASVMMLNNTSFSKSIANTFMQLVDDDFKNPSANYRPFVRWWWNGNKIEKTELARELKLLKDAGIGGVEINPISFPSDTDDMGIPSVEWLSDEWIDLLKFTLDEAKKLDLTCDLLAGTGFPFGAEFLEGDERAQVVVTAVKKLQGPLKTEISLFDLFKEADPATLSPYMGRKMEMLALNIVPDPLNSFDEVKNITDKVADGVVKIELPQGKFAIYALVKIDGFMKVIQGTTGGSGPVLNHYNEKAVKKYLNKITDTIQNRIGPLAPNIRSFFVDSLEMEGANWTSDMMVEFKKRRGYDLYPYLPFILFRTGRMGNTIDLNYAVKINPEMEKMLNRMRYDFELTKAELFRERFSISFSNWCSDNKIKSRAQAYGRGHFPLEGSFDMDIPEGETWLKYGVGEEISEKDFTKYPWHLGRGNTMINKYVSSAAHLKGKKLISSEELTNTDMVFAESLALFKIAGDQSTISGITHPIFHGFNYSPKAAAFPGWITYGGYFNENHTIWPYFKLYTAYRARQSALLQQATFFADIAIMAPIGDMWGDFGAQMEPFPSRVTPPYQMLVWESIHQNGNACDYVSEQVIADASFDNGWMSYGKRKYHTLFLIEVKSISPQTAKKLYDFVVAGGRIFCIEAYPETSLGWFNHQQKDVEVNEWIGKLKQYPERFILISKPESNFKAWYQAIQTKYGITPYVKIANPNTFISQVRYQTDNTEIFIFNNSSAHKSIDLDATFSPEIITNKQAWLWDAVTGEKYKLAVKNGQFKVKLYPADSKIIVYNSEKNGQDWQPIPELTPQAQKLNLSWKTEFKHMNGTVKNREFTQLSDLKDMPDFANFAGTVTYRYNLQVLNPAKLKYLDLGKVFGIAELFVNGKQIGVTWYGRNAFVLGNSLKKGNNAIEIKVTTVMLNYMKSLTENTIAQYWANNSKRKEQPLQPLGMVGPVNLF